MTLTKAKSHLTRADAKLGKIIKRAEKRGLTPPTRAAEGESPYEALFRSIVYQQLSGKAAETILRRVLYLCRHGKLPTEPPKNRGKFPRPKALLAMDETLLRSAGLSRAKLAAIRDLALHADKGYVPSSKKAAALSDQELIDTLTKIRGIGTWSVQMFLMFHLGRPDVWPVTDLGVQKGYAILNGLTDLPRPKDFETLGEKYRPYRSIAAWHMWRVLDEEDLVAQSRL